MDLKKVTHALVPMTACSLIIMNHDKALLCDYKYLN